METHFKRKIDNHEEVDNDFKKKKDPGVWSQRNLPGWWSLSNRVQKKRPMQTNVRVM